MKFQNIQSVGSVVGIQKQITRSKSKKKCLAVSSNKFLTKIGSAMTLSEKSASKKSEKKVQKLDFNLNHACLKDRLATESGSDAPHVLITDAAEEAL